MGFWTGLGIGILIGALTGLMIPILLIRAGFWVIGAIT